MTTGVVVDFNANLVRFTNGVDKAIADLNKFQSHTQRITANINSALGAIGLGLSGAGFVAIVKGSIDAQDKLNDLRASTQLTIATLTGLDFAAKVSGGDLESIAGSINKLAVNMGKDAEKFKALGITAKDPVEAFKQLADVFVGIQDPQLRAATGAEALGKSWAGAAPLLMEGSRGIGELIEKGTSLSGITAESAKQADAFNDKWTELFGTGKTLNTVVGSALPLLNALADDMIKARKETGALDTEFKPLLETGKAVAVLFGNISFVFKGVGTEIGGMAAQVAAIGRGDLSAAQAIGEAMKQDAAAARLSFDEWEARIMGLGDQVGSASGSAVQKARDSALEARASAFAGGKDGKSGDTRFKQLMEQQKKRIAGLNALSGDEQTVSVDSISRQFDKNLEDRAQALADAHEARMEQYRIETEGEGAVQQWIDKNNQSLKDQKDIAKDLGFTFSSAFEDAIVGGKDLSSVLQGLAQDVTRIFVRKTVTEPLGESLAGAFKGMGGGSGLLSGIKNMFTFDGGGYTGAGSRSGGLDGKGGFMAVLHPNETVVDHNKGGGAGNSVVINQVINIDSRSDQGTIAAAMVQAKNAAVAEVHNAMRRGAWA